jgi:hypothetical protein
MENYEKSLVPNVYRWVLQIQSMEGVADSLKILGFSSMDELPFGLQPAKPKGTAKGNAKKNKQNKQKKQKKPKKPKDKKKGNTNNQKKEAKQKPAKQEEKVKPAESEPVKEEKKVEESKPVGDQKEK